MTQENKHIAGFFTDLSARAHINACRKGWWAGRNKLQEIADQVGLGNEMRKALEAQLIALTHSELSEGVEGLRKDLNDDHLPEYLMIECELADAIIRILDHAARYEYRLGEAIAAKMAYNEGRPMMHGGKAF